MDIAIQEVADELGAARCDLQMDARQKNGDWDELIAYYEIEIDEIDTTLGKVEEFELVN
jgi:hypothetical protein